MGRAGGLGLVEKRGLDHMRKIAAEGGNATLAKYGTGYMAQIGSAGFAVRYARHIAPRREAAVPPERVFEMAFSASFPRNESITQPFSLAGNTVDSANSTPKDDVDKQEILEHLLNRRYISESDALRLSEHSLAEVQQFADFVDEPDRDPFGPTYRDSREWGEDEYESDDNDGWEPDYDPSYDAF